MHIEFPYKNIDGVVLPNDGLMGVFHPQEGSTDQDPDALIRRALENPLGAPPLHESARGAKRILILSDDNTRLTPVDRILPHVLRELEQAGIKQDAIQVMIAGGTHRHMTRDELEKKLGAAICREFQILQNGWDQASEIQDIGITSQGTPIAVNRHVLEADYIIAIGHIVPHRVAGFSGGSKIIQPGVCGPETTGYTHWLSARFPGAEIMGQAENPVRREMNEVAGKVGLSFLINAVQDAKGQLEALVAGDFEQAFVQGAERSHDVFRVSLPEPADLVIVDSYPADIELWQAAKGVYSANLAVADNGVIVLVTPCPEGVSVQHGSDILRFGYGAYERVSSAVESGELGNLAVAAHLVHAGEFMSRGVSVVLVSPGISADEAAKLHYRKAPSVARAVEMARSELGARSNTVVLQHGGELLPVIG